MHDLLIIFVVLLVLLTLISTLGGSIYPKEHFADEELHEKFWEEQEQEPLPETFYQEQEGEPLPETFYQEEQNVEPLPEQVTEEFRGAIKIQHKKKEHFEEEPAEDVVEGFDGDQWAAISF